MYRVAENTGLPHQLQKRSLRRLEGEIWTLNVNVPRDKQSIISRFEATGSGFLSPFAARVFSEKEMRFTPQKSSWGWNTCTPVCRLWFEGGLDGLPTVCPTCSRRPCGSRGPRPSPSFMASHHFPPLSPGATSPSWFWSPPKHWTLSEDSHLFPVVPGTSLPGAAHNASSDILIS